MKELKLEIGKKYKNGLGQTVTITDFFLGTSKFLSDWKIPINDFGYRTNAFAVFDINGNFIATPSEKEFVRSWNLIEEISLTEIVMNKKYKTRDGRPVRIIAIDEIKNCVIAELSNEIRVSWDLYGRWGSGWSNPTHLDLIEVVPPYTDFKVDDKVLVKQYHQSEWYKRYFAGVDKYGNPFVWYDGKDSWTTKDKTQWEQCIRWEDRTDEIIIDS